MKILKLFVIIMAISFSSIAYAGASFTDTLYLKRSDLAQYECLDIARSVLEQVGFVSVRSGNWLAYGRKGNYKGNIACFATNGLVVFIVAGSNYRNAERLNTKLKRNFQNW